MSKRKRQDGEQGKGKTEVGKDEDDDFSIDSLFDYMQSYGHTARQARDVIGNCEEQNGDWDGNEAMGNRVNYASSSSLHLSNRNIHAPLTDKEQDIAVKEAVNTWRKVRREHGKSVWNQGHFCDQDCRMKVLTVMVHRKRLPDGRLVVHGHTKYCLGKHERGEPMVTVLRDLYVCRDTGASHLCGKHCNLSQLNTYESWVCPATGIQVRATLLESEGVTHKTSEGSQCYNELKVSSLEKEHPLMQEAERQAVLGKLPPKEKKAWRGSAARALRKAAAKQRSQLSESAPALLGNSSSPLGNSGNTRESVDYEITESTLQKTAEFIFELLFSLKRFKQEKMCGDELVMKAFRATHAVIARCDETNTPMVLPRLVDVFADVTASSSRYQSLRFDLGVRWGPKTTQNMKVLSRHYAGVTLDFWSRILKMTEMGKTQPYLFPQRECVVGILYMMKLGHSVRTGRQSQDGLFQEAHVIIPYDSLMERILPDANNLSHYGIDHHSFTLAKNAMSSAINTALYNEGVSPTTLRMQLHLTPPQRAKSSTTTATTTPAPKTPPQRLSPRFPPSKETRGGDCGRPLAPPDEAFVGHDVGRAKSIEDRVREYARRCELSRLRASAS